MLQRWSLRLAARGPAIPTATEVATLFDWLTVTPASRVEQLMQHVQRNDATTTAERADLPNAVAQLSTSATVDAAHPRIWAETVVLLTRSGSGSQAVTALRNLPDALRQAVLEDAARRGLPPAVRQEFSEQLGLSSSDGGHREVQSPGDGRRNLSSSVSPPPLSTTATSTTVCATSAAHTSLSLSVKELSTQELVERAFALHRPHGMSGTASSFSSSHMDSAVSALVAQQSQIFRELAARGRYRELVQCVAHWSQKHLLMTHPEAVRLADSAPATTPTETTGGATTAVALFDGLHALKETLFPTTAPASHSAASALGSRAARHHLLTTQPILYARLVRDARVAERALRLDGPDQLRDAVLLLLRTVAATTPGTERGGASLPALRLADADADPAGVHVARAAGASLRPHVSSSALRENATVTSLDTLWRGIAGLARLLLPALRRERNAHKQALMSALAAATLHTAALWGRVPVALPPRTDKTVTSMRATTESLCSALLHNEAQVRFVGLSTFATVAEALESLSPESGLPNALMQCLLLTLNGPVHPTAPAAPSGPVTSRTRSTGPSSLLSAYLAADSLTRWKHALALLLTAQEREQFVVTSAHLRTLLSGLQSVSIVKTWRQALACTDVCVHQLGLSPDESSLERLLLNWKQSSWQDAFRVLDYLSPSDTASAETACARSSGKRRRASSSLSSSSSLAPVPPSPPARLLRDLQLVAVKHASWEVTLHLMDQLMALDKQTRQAHDRSSSPVIVVGFMNRVYSLYAAASGGQVDTALAYLASLADAPQYRVDRQTHQNLSPQRRREPSVSSTSVSSSHRIADAGPVLVPKAETLRTSPFNAVTVAIGAMALLDKGHFAGCAVYGERVLHRFSATRCSEDAAEGSPRAPFHLTKAGEDVADAAIVLGFLFSDQKAALVAHLNALCVATSADTRGDHGRSAESPVSAPLPRLSRVLHSAMVLQGMRNLQHLSAPVRLVFDTLSEGSYDAADDVTSFETRQRATAAKRRPLYIPPRHYRTQVKELATALAELVASAVVSESSGGEEPVVLSSQAAQLVAEAVTSAGFGPEFLSITLLGGAE